MAIAITHPFVGVHVLKKTNRILVVTDHMVHLGLAQSNRILSYSEAFTAANCKVDILMYRTGYGGAAGTVPIRGSLGSANYYYSANTTQRNGGFWKRRVEDGVGLWNAFRFILGIRNGGECAAIFYTVNPFSELLLLLACRVRGIKRAKELSEHPSVYFNKNSFPQKLLYRYYAKFGMRFYTHFLVMTDNLIRALEPMISRAARVLLVPMTVDLSRFERRVEPSADTYIAYAGQLNEDKDGVATLIRAFAMIAGRHERLKLYLAGKYSDREAEAEIGEQVRSCQVADRIVFTGSISRDQIPPFLLNATLLVLARPDSLQAQMGFPTKLGEYLATGNPVVVTRVGEIPNYLEHGISAVFAEPGNVQHLAEMMDQTLSNPTWGSAIGACGRQVAIRNFDNFSQAHRILDFLDERSRTADRFVR